MITSQVGGKLWLEVQFTSIVAYSEMNCCECSSVVLLLTFIGPLLLVQYFQVVDGKFLMRKVSNDMVMDMQDVNIGVLQAFTAHTHNALCGTSVVPARVHLPEAIKYIFERVNAENALPNGLKLGYIILDTCSNPRAAVVQSMRFVSLVKCDGKMHDGQRCSSSDEATPSVVSDGDNQTDWACGDGHDEDSHDVKTPVKEALQDYSVAGLICCTLSSTSQAVYHVMFPVHIPMVSFSATSDYLSGASFSYFFRVVPPDSYQFQAIAAIIEHFGWGYVSVVYSTDAYGENGFEQLEKALQRIESKQVCLAVQINKPVNLAEGEAEQIAEKLVASKANVVVLIHSDGGEKIMQAANSIEGARPLIWLASDAIDLDGQFYMGKRVLGSMYVSFKQEEDERFSQHFKGLQPDNVSDPWLKRALKEHCCKEGEACAPSQQAGVVESNLGRYTQYLFDTVHVYAKAARRAIKKHFCHAKRGEQLRQCVGGKRLLAELKAITLEGVTGSLEFDKNGDRLSKYNIKQLVHDPNKPFKAVVLATYDSVNQRLDLMRNASWPQTLLSPGHDTPVSVCSVECPPGQERVELSSECCWKCRPCHANERVTKKHQCQACPRFHWPTEDRQHCVALSVDRWRASDSLGVIHICLISILLVVSVFVLAFRVIYRMSRVLRSDFVWVTRMTFVGIIMGLVSTLLFLMEPTDRVCRTIFNLLSVSFNLVLAPLTVRSICLFVVFQLHQLMPKQDEEPGYAIKTRAQVAFCVLLVAVQAVICIIMNFTFDIWHSKFQEPMQPHVELTCSLPGQALLASFIYNAILLTVSAVLVVQMDFLKRGLIENHYLTDCIGSIAIIVLCLAPAYVIGVNNMIKTTILIMAVIFNNGLVLFFLYLPVIMAVYRDDSLKTETGHRDRGLFTKFRLDDRSNINTASLAHPNDVREGALVSGKWFASSVDDEIIQENDDFDVDAVQTPAAQRQEPSHTASKAFGEGDDSIVSNVDLLLTQPPLEQKLDCQDKKAQQDKKASKDKKEARSEHKKAHTDTHEASSEDKKAHKDTNEAHEDKKAHKDTNEAHEYKKAHKDTNEAHEDKKAHKDTNEAYEDKKAHKDTNESHEDKKALTNTKAIKQVTTRKPPKKPSLSMPASTANHNSSA